VGNGFQKLRIQSFGFGYHISQASENKFSTFAFLLFMLKYFLILSLFFSPILCFAQKWDIGFHGGLAGYQGEINLLNPLKFNEPDFGAHVRRNLDPNFSIRLGFDQAWILGEDSKSKNPDQIQRNLSFESSITEASLVFEFNFFKFNPFDRQEKFSPYLMAGLGGFIYNPYTYLNGNKVFLRTVGTEGQLIPPPNRLSYYPSQYGTVSWNIPVGVGIKYHLKGNWSLNAEYGYRFTFTDYLDDIGGLYPDVTNVNPNSDLYLLSDRSVGHVFKAGDQRGDSRSFDKYFFGNVSITYTFRSLDCPKFNH